MDFLLFLLPSNESPEGEWVRSGDQFAGCIVQVAPHGSELAGKIVALPEAMRRTGWQEGELKWRNIQFVDGSWQLQDTRKHFDPNTNTVKMVDYRTYRLTLGALGRLRLHSGPQPFFPDQQWARYNRPSAPNQTTP